MPTESLSRHHKPMSGSPIDVNQSRPEEWQEEVPSNAPDAQANGNEPGTAPPEDSLTPSGGDPK